MILTIKQTDTCAECNVFDVTNESNQVVAYYYEYFLNPETDEKLSEPVYEIYYNYDADTADYNSSLLTDCFDEIEELIESLEVDQISQVLK
jgi:hypothetical protein